MARQPNVKVKVDHRGRLQVFVNDTLMAGTLDVKYESVRGQCGVLHIEVIGLMVEFEQLPRPEKETCRGVHLMPRSVPEWIGATDDTPVPPRVKARVLLRHKRKCHRTGLRIRSGAPWETEHVKALINGGENRESNLAPILAGKAHREKTNADVAEKSKVARMRLKDLGIYPKPLRKIPSRPFQKRVDIHA